MLFRNEKLQKQFDLNGYIVLPFLNEKQIAELRDHFFATHTQIPDGFYSSSFHTDENHKLKINEKIESVLSGPVSATLSEIKKLGTCYLNKQPGAQSEMPIHQDWTVVDEPHYDSVTIWIPLQDVNEQNGAIQVIDGSHRFTDAMRSPSMEDPFKNIQEELRKDLKLLPMKAGDAFIFSQALLHASPANMSTEPRIAVTYGLIDANAQLIFYHHENGIAEQYLMEQDFFQRYNTQIGQRPNFGELHKTFDYQQHFVSPEEYKKMKHNFLQHKTESMYKMIPIFQDKTKQEFFEKEGFAVFPLLGEEEITQLKTLYESKKITDEKGFGFHVSMDNADKDMCREIRDKVWALTLPRLSEHLQDFKPFVASYVIKEVNPKGVVPAHQDWSFADREEDGYSSITCWIALVDTNLDNGELGVIRGSHKFMQNHRPSPSPQSPVPLSEHMFSIFPYLHTIDMKAGEVLMFDNRTFHASPPNVSGAVRLAVGVGVTQKDAQLIHYNMKPDGTFKTILRYNVDEDFYLKYNNTALAEMYDAGKLIEGYGEPVEVAYEFTKYSSDELIDIVKAAGNTFNIPMTEKLAKLFSLSGELKTEPVQKQAEPEPAAKQEPIKKVEEWKWVDKRSFVEKYTLKNIATEIKKRLVGA
jgi:ectoine hydroxylase-related dioxygenase (phytanoyl-CoA dioxygenase family)